MLDRCQCVLYSEETLQKSFASHLSLKTKLHKVVLTVQCTISLLPHS